ncbi:hypothetical protein CG723_16360 [Streptomyces sp. CB01635]|nr:hypothetical protein CG723_16360 [Streptomyces sp. CB01635]
MTLHSAGRAGEAPSTEAPGPAALRRLRRMLALIHTSHSAATTVWAFAGAILIAPAVGWYIRMNLT